MHIKSGAYYYVTNGKPRKWISLGKDLGKAKLEWARIENLESGQGSFIEGLEEWYQSRRFSELSEASQKAYRKVKPALLKVFANANYSDILPTHIAAWLDEHESKVNANIGRAVISNVFEVAVRRGKADRNPCKDMPALTIKARTRYMTNEEFIAIREKANDVIRVCMDIGYLTGMRITDILNLRFSDIRDDGLYVIQHKTQSKQCYSMTQELRMVLDVAKSLPRSVKNITHLLCNRSGKPYPYSAINVMFWTAKNAAGIPDVRFHDIRAKSATDAKAQGLDYQSLLGHASKAMSDKYIRAKEFVKTNPLRNVL